VKERIYSALLNLAIVLLRWADRFYLWAWYRHAVAEGTVRYEGDGV
jgi:hypothetical protein